MNDGKLQHRRQLFHYDCGAACYAQIVNIDISAAIIECHTKKSGTHIDNVVRALNRRNIENYTISLNVEYPEYEKWLILNSNNRFLYLSCRFVSNSGRGRNSLRKHAILCYNGYIYDPSEDISIPAEAFYHNWNKKLILKEMILIDRCQKFFQKTT